MVSQIIVDFQTLPTNISDRTIRRLRSYDTLRYESDSDNEEKG